MLAGAEDLEQDLGGLGVARPACAASRSGSGRAATNRSRLVSAMPGSGHRGRTASSCDDDPRGQLQAVRPACRARSRRSRHAALGVAHPQADQPLVQPLGIVVMVQEPVGSHSASVSRSRPARSRLAAAGVRRQVDAVTDGVRSGATCWRWRKISSTSPWLEPEGLGDLALVDPRLHRAAGLATANGRSRSGSSGWGV